MDRKGFTLLELIVVLIVLSVLIAIALPQYTAFVERGRALEAINALGSIKTAEEANRISGTANSYNAATADGDVNANLGLSIPNASWSYTVTAATGVSFTATATKKIAPNLGNTVILTYTSAGVTSWGGNHPGAPK